MDVLEPKLEISTEKLIQAVKKRTALYSKENPNYHLHGKYKGQLWKEVCREVFPDWCNLSPRKRLEYAHDLQRRWKNLRTCFTRELLQQKKEVKSRENPSGDAEFKRRKKYVYFDLLTFLINPEEIPEAPEVKMPVDEDSTDPLEPEMFQLESEESAYEESSSRGLSNQHYVEIDEPFQPNVFHRDENIKQEVLHIMGDLKKKSEESEDEDRQFVLSIVPALRKLNDKQKFDAKIEILKVLKRISTGDDS